MDTNAQSWGSQDVEMLVGGFGPLNDEHSKGIEQYRLSRSADSAGAVTLQHVALAAALPSPTWLVRDGRKLYAVLENSSRIATLRIEGEGNGEGEDAGERGGLRLIDEGSVPVRGSGPTHATLADDDRGARHLLAANYADGSISVHPMDDQGRVLEATQLLEGSGSGPLAAQEGPHAHWVLCVPDGRVLSTDLGADRIHIHQWHGGVLQRIGSVRLLAGTGPRDMHLLPTTAPGWRVAVVGEWGNTVTVLAADEAGADVHVVQSVDLGGDDGDQAASLAYVSGFAYVGLRGSDRIVTLTWDGESLSRIDHPWIDGWRGRGISCGGSRPRQILAVGDLLLIANEASDGLAVFQLHADGRPEQVAVADAGSPTVLLPL